MKPRLDLGEAVGDGLKGMFELGVFPRRSGVPRATLELVRIRASQINGCGFCLDMHWREAVKAGETDERLHSVAAWREVPFFTEAERAALALAEAGTRLSDREQAVPDAVWDEAARHFSEQELGGLVMAIATINAWNRINVMTRQLPGTVLTAGARPAASDQPA